MSYCVNCGKEINPGTAFCPNCGASVTADAEYCLGCGVSLKKAAGAQGNYLNGQDKVVMILISLFLGGFGIHNFMMGETKKGIFRIIMTFCLGLGYIFALIDLIKIASGSYVVDPEKLV